MLLLDHFYQSHRLQELYTPPFFLLLLYILNQQCLLPSSQLLTLLCPAFFRQTEVFALLSFLFYVHIDSIVRCHVWKSYSALFQWKGENGVNSLASYRCRSGGLLRQLY